MLEKKLAQVEAKRNLLLARKPMLMRKEDSKRNE
jgi:hypothetical protein